MTTTLRRICETETALQAAWSRGDGPTAKELRAQLGLLWHARRVELAQRHKNEARDWGWRVPALGWTP